MIVKKMPKSKKKRKKGMSAEKLALIEKLAREKVGLGGEKGQFSPSAQGDGGSKVGASVARIKQVKTSSGDR